MVDDQEFFQIVFTDMLFKSLTESVLRILGEDGRLLVNLRIAEPVAICAVDVAARRQFDQQKLEDRLSLARICVTANDLVWMSDVGVGHVAVILCCCFEADI